MNKKINPQRLSRIITSREVQQATDHLINNVIAPMSSEQRHSIKYLLNQNLQNREFKINPIYK